MKRSSTEGSLTAAEKEGFSGSALGAGADWLDLNGFELLEAGAPTDLNALLIGSVLVAAAGVAAGLGNVTAEFEDGLRKPVDSESPSFSELPDVNAELIGFEGACLGAAEGAVAGLWKPVEAEGAAVGLVNPAAGAAEGL